MADKPTVESVKLECKECGKEFKPRTKWQLYCSPRCRDAWHNTQRIIRGFDVQTGRGFKS